MTIIPSYSCITSDRKLISHVDRKEVSSSVVNELPGRRSFQEDQNVREDTRRKANILTGIRRYKITKLYDTLLLYGLL